VKALDSPGLPKPPTRTAVRPSWAA